MDEKDQIEGSLYKLQREFDVVSGVHEGDYSLKPEHAHQFEQSQQLDLVANVIDEDAEDFVDWHSSEHIDEEHAF